MNETKKCFKCGEVKGASEYYGHPQMGDGKLGKCKECTKRDVRENRARNIEHYREFDRKRAMLPHRVEMRAKYQATDAGKEACNKGKRAYTARNPIKRVAVNAVASAIKSGRINRQLCEQCGRKAQAHHDDYSKPLDVRWLCTTHHREWHKHNTPLCPDQEKAA